MESPTVVDYNRKKREEIMLGQAMNQALTLSIEISKSEDFDLDSHAFTEIYCAEVETMFRLNKILYNKLIEGPQ